ncbi:MAG TPA: class I SAM-dependent methyltransferase [Solirubrobacteraceae bacterium]
MPRTALARQYCKLCDVRDFEDVELIAAVRDLVPERDALAYIERKVWEFAMVMLFLRDVERLHDGTAALSVGAGNERILFWLANRIGRVVATDIYGEGDFGEREAEGSMLTDPGAHAPGPYRSDRLEVMWMDGRRLDFEDETFDVVFTVSSIEHFGSPADIRAAAREIGRVLKPGGHAVVITECFVLLHPLNTALVDFAIRLGTLGRGRRRATPRRRAALDDVFTRRELYSRIVEPSGLRLMQPLDGSLSPQSWDNLTRATADGRLVSATGERYPLVLMQIGRSVFTSVCLVLEKPDATPAGAPAGQ